jgi:hypothetical protein
LEAVAAAVPEYETETLGDAPVEPVLDRVSDGVPVALLLGVRLEVRVLDMDGLAPTEAVLV